VGAFDGFWVNGDTARGHTVADHAMDVMYQPHKYGLTPDDVGKITGGKTTIATGDASPESTRGQLVIAAAKKGWARVRAVRGSYTVQLHGSAASRIKRILPFLTKNGMHPNSDVTLHDMSTGFHQKFDGVSAINKALRRDEIPDTVSTREVGKEAQAMGAKGAAQGIPCCAARASPSGGR